MATRCMLSAEYFCSGSVSKETFGHYGLASPIYTHFTSPIRRYAGEEAAFLNISDIFYKMSRRLGAQATCGRNIL